MFKRVRNASSKNMARKWALRGFEKGKTAAFKNQSTFNKRYRKYSEKISRCNIEFSSVTRELRNEEIYRTSAKIVQKNKKAVLKRLINGKNNFRGTDKISTDSFVKKYFVMSSQKL